MPLTIPSLIEIKTAAGATAAFLSPESDGLKECFIDNELNGQCILTFSIPTTSDKKQYLTEAYRIYAPDSTGTMKEFVILTPDSIDRTRDGEAVWDKITAQESWVKLGKDYVDPGISNDPQTPSPPALAVIVLSGGSDLSGGLYAVGSSAHALYAILQGTGWTVGTADQTGTHDLETEKISVLANIQKIQETWGGYLVWDSVNKTVSLRDEETWAEYTGYQIRYAKNLKGITRTSDFDIITKLYPFGEDDLNIGSVNGGQIYLINNTYTAETLEGIYTNQDKTTAQELKDDATKYLAKVCKPRHNYRIDQVDLRTLSGYTHESFDVGHMVDIIDADLDTDDQARVIRHRFNVFQPWICELEVGDPLDTDAKLMADSQITVKYLNAIKNSKGQITAYKLVDESLIASKIAAAAVDATKLNTKVVVLVGDTWADNSPASGSVAWNQHKLYYSGTEYTITAGNTANKYIYWDGAANAYSTSATDPTPTLADGQFIVAVNNAGLHDTVWDKGYAREFIGSALIADAAILSAHIGEAQVLDAHIASLTANKITSGQILSYLVEIMGKNGYFRINGDEFLCYDKSGALMGRFGHYETLAAQTATFTRASPAYDSYGNLIASGAPRYEYMRQPAPVWQDLFDADQLAAEYTSGGDVAAAWAVSGGVATGTGGTQATLIKNNLLLQDCDIIINSDQAYQGGIIARYQDNYNYYLLRLSDDSGAYPVKNLTLLKRVAGAWVELGSADVTWARGTSKPINFTLHGSRMEAYFDGVKVISVTDTTYTGGGVGLRNSSATAFRVLDFTVYYAQQGVMSEEANTNIVRTNAAADPLFNASTDWTLTNATVASGVLTLQSPDGVAMAIAFCTLTSLVQSTPHSFLIRARYKDTTGTAQRLTLDLQGSGYDNAEQQLDILSSQLTTAFQNFKKDGFDSGLAPASVNLRIFTASTRPIEVEFIQLEQKAFATTVMDGSRVAEVMTVPSSVFTKSSWTVKLKFTPTSVTTAEKLLWHCYIDASNEYRISVRADGSLSIGVRSGGVWYLIFGGSASVVGNKYFISASGNGSTLRLLCNGVQIGSDTAYVEPVGTLPANMYIGCYYSGAYQANGILSDFAVLNKAQTLAEHQADYATGLPLTVDDATTYLMSCDGTLQPTVRGFGLWSKNGRYILQDPAAGQGIEVWDGAVRNIIFGRLDDGRIGGELSKCDLFANNIYSGVKGSNSYVGMTADNSLIVQNNGNKVLETLANSNQGHLSFFEGGVRRGRISAGGQSTPTLYVEAVDEAFSYKKLYLKGSEVEVYAGTILLDPVVEVLVQGAMHVAGTFTSSDKQCYETTSQGVVGLYTRESPDVRYIDEGRAQLVNGQCIIDLLTIEPPLFPECVESESDLTMWHVHLTPIGKFTPCVIEIYDAYIAIASIEHGVNGSFTWSLSATRKGKTGVRFPRMEWLVGGDEENDPVLVSNWEDEILSGV